MGANRAANSGSTGQIPSRSDQAFPLIFKFILNSKEDI